MEAWDVAAEQCMNRLADMERFGGSTLDYMQIFTRLKYIYAV